MSNSGRTNQCLYFVRQTLDELEACSDQQSKKRLEEAALFHMMSAVHSYVNELIRQYNLPPFQTLSDLLGREQQPSEIQELIFLNQNSSSWFSAMNRIHQKCLTEGLNESGSGHQLITSQSDNLSLFRNWLIELENLINRQREHYLEC